MFLRVFAGFFECDTKPLHLTGIFSGLDVDALAHIQSVRVLAGARIDGDAAADAVRGRVKLETTADKENVSLQCDLCGRIYLHRSSLIRHLKHQSCQSSVQAEAQCLLCSYKCKQAWRLAHHVARKHSPTVRLQRLKPYRKLRLKLELTECKYEMNEM